MRRLRPILALFALAAVAIRAFGARREKSNVRRLADRLGASTEDAQRLFRLSRERGYGAAHEAVFGRREPALAAVPRDGDDVDQVGDVEASAEAQEVRPSEDAVRAPAAASRQARSG